MKRALGYFGMALAGGLLALSVHQKFFADDRGSGFAARETSSTPVKLVNLPTSGGGSMVAVDFTQAAEKSVDAVVHVTTKAMMSQRDPFQDFFWGYRQAPQREVQGAGSGVIISEDGYIVTNNHVVEGADEIVVHLDDKRNFDAKVIGRDPSTDIALIKVDGSGFPTLAFGNSDEVKVGQWVLAVGNPMNLTSTVTAGIVSAKARNINILQYDQTRDVFPIESFIQTDAAVNPGNSGGALVDASGDLIGINSAIASTTGAYTGYSFAIPANIVRKVTGDLMEFGSVQRAYIGVSIGDVDQDVAKEAGLDRPRGVYVRGLTEGGAAADAGMAAGDVIVKVGSISVDNVPQLQEQVGKFRPGDKVAVTIMRDGQERVLDMTLRGRNGGTTVSAKKETAAATTVLGAEMASASASELKALQLPSGVKVVTLNGGKLRSIGVKEGFIITKVDRTLVKDPQDVLDALSNKQGGVLIEGYYPNGSKAYYGLGV